MRSRCWLLAGAIGLMAAGCSNNEVLVRKQAEMEARMEQLIQANVANTGRMNELSTAVHELQGEVKGNSASLAELRTSLESMSQRKEAKTPPPSSAKIGVVDKGGASGDSDSPEQDAYMKAFGLFGSNNYPAAIAAFESFIKAHPTSEYAGNAQYWIGECYYTQRDYPRALEAFNTVVQKYANGKKVPDALLKVGFTLISLNEPDKARTVLETLVEKYPKSPAAAKARERLSR